MGILLLLFLTALVAGFVWSVVWSYRDAKLRGKPPLLVALFVLFASWPLGLVAWILFRPEVPANDRRAFNLEDYRA